jgi:hypothetical protein
VVNKESWEGVGLTPDKRAAWLLDFGGIDYDALVEPERERLRCKLTALLTLFQMGPALWPGIKLHPFPMLANSVSADTAKTFHRWLKDGLDSILRGFKWTFPVTAVYEIDLLRVAPGVLAYRIDPDTTEEINLLKLMTFEVVRGARKRLKQCEECRRLFIPRRQQRYCSPDCSQAVRTRRWREKDPDHVRELRARQHKRSVRRRKGMTDPKIERRSRKEKVR